MLPSRSLLRGAKRRSPQKRRRRRWSPLRMVAGLGLCTLAACALYSPGLVFGASDPQAVEAASPPAIAVEQPETGDQGPTPITDPTLSAAAAPGQVSAGNLLVELPWGSGDGEVGLDAPSEGLTRGPEALAIAPDGRIAVLDSVNHRLVVLDADGAFACAIPVALAAPRFLAASDERLFVLDCDAERRMMSVGWNGEEPRVSELPALDDVVTGLFATDAGACVETGHDQVLLVAEGAPAVAATDSSGPSRPGGVGLRPIGGRPIDQKFGPIARVTYSPAKRLQIKEFRLDRDTLEASLGTDSSPTLFARLPIEHLVSVDGDGRGGLVVGARLLAAGSGKTGDAALVVSRFASAFDSAGVNVLSQATAGPDRVEAATLLLPECSFAYLGQPYVVAPDGRIFLPVADETGYSLMVHTFADTQGVTQ